MRILNKYRLLLVGLAIIFSSCTKDESLEYEGAGGVVEVSFMAGASPAAAVSSNESDVNRLRVVIFGSVGSPDASRLILNKYHVMTPVDTNFKELITTGERDIYLIANEPLSKDGQELDSYKNIATVADIRSLSLAYQGAVSVGAYVPTEIPMFIEHQNRRIEINSDNDIMGALERTMAKVTMKLNVKNDNFPTGKHVVIDHMVIKNLPQSSFLKATHYSDELVTSERQNPSITVTKDDYNFSSNNTFYVPEYIFSSDDNVAYFEITGHVNGEPTRVATWKVKLGDAMDDTGLYGSRYTITRNRHYIFTGDVKSYGEMDELAVKVTVKPWGLVDMNEDGGRYVSYSGVTDAEGTVIADGAELDAMGATLKVSCSTNTGEWYAVTSNAEGKVLNISTPTAAVSAVTIQTVDVVIPRLVDVTSVPSYTVSIYHSIIAPESVGPVKLLSFAQKVSTVPHPPTADQIIEINGAKWTTGNLIAVGSVNAKVGKPTDGGLYFQFGSLIGWSGGATGDGTGAVAPKPFIGPALGVIVRPSEYSGTLTPPYADNGLIFVGAQGDIVPFATDNGASAIGDPCRLYLGEPWQLPTKENLETLSKDNAWQASPAGVNFNNTGTKLFFPASGFRFSSGSPSQFGEVLLYWSATAYNEDGAYGLQYANHSISHWYQGYYNQFALPVRCMTPPPAAISVTPTTQAHIPSSGGVYTVNVTSNYAWSVSSTVSGVAFDPSSGAAGTNVSVNITVPANTDFTALSVPVVFTTTGGGTTATTAWTGTQLPLVPTTTHPPTVDQIIEIKGAQWTTGNLVAVNGNNAKVGAPTDYGLYFQFGSLVGWSGGATGDGTGTGSPALAISTTPSAYTGSTAYTSCGYYSGGVAGDILPATDVAATGIGDPCRLYLGKPWQLPTREDFSSLCNSYAAGSDLGAANAAWQVSPAGMNFNNNNSAKLFLPAPGGRSFETGSFSFVGTYGSYWSASVSGNDNGYCLDFGSNKVTPQGKGNGRNGYSVRCVVPAPAATISVTPTTKVDIPVAGGTYTVNVVSNYAWSVSSAGGATVNPSQGGVGLASVEITVPANATTSVASYPVVFTTTGGPIPAATATWTGAQLAPSRPLPPPPIEYNGLGWASGNLVADGANGAKIGVGADIGLYFQFGSLIGWSGGTNGDGTGTGSPALTLQVKPTGYTGDTAWSACGYSSGAIPASDVASTGIGDPCRFYLGSPWRLPTYTEFLAMCNNYTGGSNFVSASVAWQVSPAGMNFNNNSDKLFLPASGYRNTDGSFSFIGTYGYYWSASALNADNGYNMRFSSGTVGPRSYFNRRNGLPVRCVQSVP